MVEYSKYKGQFTYKYNSNRCWTLPRTTPNGWHHISIFVTTRPFSLRNNLTYADGVRIEQMSHDKNMTALCVSISHQRALYATLQHLC